MQGRVLNAQVEIFPQLFEFCPALGLYGDGLWLSFLGNFWLSSLFCSLAGLFVADRKLFSAFIAASFQNSSSVFCLHSGTEAVRFCSLTLFRLISSFGHAPTLASKLTWREIDYIKPQKNGSYPLPLQFYPHFNWGVL